MAEKDSTLDLVRQWTEINQNLWNNWLSSTRHLGKGPSGIDEAYHEQLKGLQKVVDDTMRLERDWMEIARDQSTQNQAMEPAVKFMTDMAETALETRSRIWRAVFDNAQAVNLDAPANALGVAQAPQEFLASMREFAERFMGAQAQAAGAAAPGTEAAPAAGTEAAGGQASKQAKTG